MNKSNIIKDQPRTVLHKRNQAEKVPSLEVPIWRGIDKKLQKYILTNKYYPVKILKSNELDFLLETK